MPGTIATMNDIEHILPLMTVAVIFIGVSVAIDHHSYTTEAWIKESHFVDSEKLTGFLLLLTSIDVAFIFPLDISSSFSVFIMVILIKIVAFIILHLRFCSGDDLDLFLLADCLFLSSIFLQGVADSWVYLGMMCFIGFLAWRFSPSPRKLIAFIVSIASILLPVLVDVAFLFLSLQSEILHFVLLLFIYGSFKLTGSMLFANNRI